MNPEDFLSTGILEAYALGQATPDEARLAEEMRGKYPEVEAEYQALAAALETGAAQLAKPAPAGLWDKIRTQIETENESEGLKSVSIPAERPVSGSQRTLEDGRGGGARIVPMTPARGRSFGSGWGWTASLAAALVLSIGANLVQLNQNSSLKQDLAASEKSLEVIAHTTSQSKAEMERLKGTNAHMEGLLSQALTPKSGIIQMASMPVAGKARAAVAYDNGNHMVAVRVSDMPDMPEGKVVQLWAIVSGKPVSLGDATLAAEGQLVMAEMPPMDGAPEAFALSMETGGIHAQPEGPILAMGKVN